MDHLVYNLDTPHDLLGYHCMNPCGLFDVGSKDAPTLTRYETHAQQSIPSCICVILLYP